MLFALITHLCISCKKEDPIPKHEGITIEDLEGDWVFLNLQFNGKTTFFCDSTLNQSYDFITLDFYSVYWNYWVGAPFIRLNTSCMDSGDEPQWQKEYQFTLLDSVINCNDEFKFKIMKIGTYQNLWALTVKLTYSSIPDVPINGIYTLGKTP